MAILPHRTHPLSTKTVTGINIWLPFWFMSRKDEESHLIATIAIEQSVAPPPPEENGENGKAEDAENDLYSVEVVPYKCTHPNIEGTAHDKPIPELPAASAADSSFSSL